MRVYVVIGGRPEVDEVLVFDEVTQAEHYYNTMSKTGRGYYLYSCQLTTSDDDEPGYFRLIPCREYKWCGVCETEGHDDTECPVNEAAHNPGGY